MYNRHRQPSFELSRRQFLKAGLALGLVSGAGSLLTSAPARAAGVGALTRPVLVNIALDGGPDLRHLLPPAWSSVSGSFGNVYWQARARAQQAEGGASASQSRWQSGFHACSQGHTQFGISRKCGFLKRLWDSGNLALVNNVYGATSRDHDHAKRVMEQGNMLATPVSDGSGWGGRLALAAGGNAVALSQAARHFAFGPDRAAPGDLTRASKTDLVHIANMRQASLYQPDPNEWQGPPHYVARSLKGYYAAKRPSVPQDSPYFAFMEQERMWRTLGDQIEERLKSVPVPDALSVLANANTYANAYIGLQARNLYDAIACHDILNLRVASLEYPGWDTHTDQAQQIESYAEHLFGDAGILATLQQLLPPETWTNLAFVIGGEFGRQLRDNGAAGTDHGVGTSIVVLGGAVRGGLYGEMFPESELTRLNEPSPDIEGRTALDHVFGAVCNWVAPNAKGVVFPSHNTMPTESGVLLGGLIG